MIDKAKKEEIQKSPTFQAAHIAFQNGLTKGYDLQAMAHHMFIEGIKFANTGKAPELLL